jgi:hypothetical protein
MDGRGCGTERQPGSAAVKWIMAKAEKAGLLKQAR